MPQDLKLDELTHDLDFSNNVLEIVSGSGYLKQKLKIVLRFFFAEWFLDTTIGIKFWEEIFVKSPNLTLIDSLFKVAIIEVPGVDQITAYDSIFSNDINRRLTITFTVSTDYGELSLKEVF